LCNEAHGVEPFVDAFLIAKNKIDLVFNNRVEEVISKLEDKYYDIIFFNDVLEHLIDPENVLMQFKTKLSRDGIIITSVPNVRNLGNLYNLLVKKDWEYVESGILDNTHLRFFTFKSFERTVRNAGYDLKYIGGNEVNKINFKGVKSIFNLLFIPFFEDTRYLQILSVLSIKG
jgi:2-polyprenyl-3-methyl-5-hydroxy-6-metoxy-1,4-benzoquinol methylase